MQQRNLFAELKLIFRHRLRKEIRILDRLGKYDPRLAREAEFLRENQHLFTLSQLCFIREQLDRQDAERWYRVLKWLAPKSRPV